MALELQRIDPYNGDSLSATTYYGYAKAGAQDYEPIWSIKRKVVVGGVLQYQYPYITGTTLAETNPAIFMQNVYYIQASELRWDMRTGYTYR
jgi:hypothetical protein